MFKKLKRLLVFVVALSLFLGYFSSLVVRAEEQPETTKIIEFMKEKGEKETPLVYKTYRWGVKEAMDNMVVLLKTLMGMGLTPEAASAIAGNVKHESNFDSSCLEDGLSYEEVARRNDRGLGYFQWTDFKRKNAFLDFAKKLGKPWTDREVQLAYFYEETLSEKPTQGSWFATRQKLYPDVYNKFRCEPFNTIEEFKTTTDIERATVIFARNWERPNARVAQIGNRVKSAEEINKLISMFIDSKTIKTTSKKQVDNLNKLRTDASVEELQMARGVKMYQESVLTQVQNVELTNEESLNSTKIKQGSENSSKSKDYREIRAYISLLGWIIVSWGIFALIVWLMARRDSLIAVHLIKLVLINKGTNGLGGLYACIGLIITGLFILSGLFFKLLLYIF